MLAIGMIISVSLKDEIFPPKNNLTITLSAPKNEKEKETYNDFIKDIENKNRIINIKTVNDNIEITIRKK